MKIILIVLFALYGCAYCRPAQPSDLNVESLSGSQVPVVRKARQFGYGYNNYDFNPYNDTPNNYDNNPFNDSPHRQIYNNFDFNPFNDSPNNYDRNPYNDSGFFGKK